MAESIKLSNLAIGDLPDKFAVPNYDRSGLTPGIVHVGLGNFHRAHQSWYLHRLFQMGLNHDWAIIGAGVRKFDADQREKLRAQDYLTTLIELDPCGKSAEVVGAMIDYVPVEAGNGALIDQMADPAIRIVSLTVTEGGYYTDALSKDFDAAHPDILRDAANPESPGTAFGAMIASLKRRRAAGKRAIHLPKLRQSSRQRYDIAANRCVVGSSLGSVSGGLDRCQLHFSQLDGGLHSSRHRPWGNRACP